MAFWLWMGAITLAFAALLLVLAVLSRIRVRIRYAHSGEQDQLVIIVRALYGLFRYRAVIPSVLMRSREWLFIRESSLELAGMQKTNKAQISVGMRTIKRKWEAYLGILRATRNFRNWLRNTMKKVECTRFRLDLRIGTGDAASTAIASGLLWAVYGCVFGYVGNVILLKTKPYGAVEPVYRGTELSVVWEADFQIRLSTAMGALLKLGIHTVKIGQAIRSWRRWVGASNPNRA